MAANVTIKVLGHKCERCGHEWVARAPRNVAPGKPKKNAEPPKPRTCPSCKSAWWDVPPGA